MTSYALSQSPMRDDGVPQAKIESARLHGVDVFWVAGFGIAVVSNEADPEEALRGLHELMAKHDLLSGELLFPSTARIPKFLMSRRSSLANQRVSVARAAMPDLEASAKQSLTAFWQDRHAAAKHLMEY